jgi:predicted Kef-type K+ transport protein
MDIVWIGGAFIAGLLVSRLRLPPLIGYLGAGLLLGAYGYEAGETLHHLSHIGVLLLLFSVGLHIRVRDVFRLDVLGVGLIHLILFSGLMWGLLAWTGLEGPTALILAILLGFSSTILTAKSLEARSELGALHGRIAIGVLILQDLVAIGIIAYSSGSTPSVWSVGLLALPLLRPVLLWVFQFLREEELTLLFGVVLALAGAALFDLMGLSQELGAIAFGMILAGNEKADQLESRLWSVKEIFLIGFFLDIGLQGIPDGRSASLIALSLFAFPLKTVLFFALFIVFRFRARTSFMAGASLTTYSEFMLIAGAAASRAGLIPSELMVTMAMIVVISFIVNATLSRWEDAIWGMLEGVLCRFERNVRHPDKQVVSLGSAEFLVVGMGTAGVTAYGELKERGRRVVGMDIDPERLERNLEAGRKVIYGDIQDIDMWQSLDLRGIRAVLIAMGNKQSKANAIRIMRDTGYAGGILAITMRPDEIALLESLGAVPVSIPIREAGKRLAELSCALAAPS